VPETHLTERPPPTDRPAPARPLDLPSPPASRLAAPRWLDARLVVGVLLVLGSVLLGTRVVASADDTTGVLAVQRDLPAGVRLSAGDLVERRIRLDGGIERYLAAGSPVDGYVLTRPVGAGELLPAAAVVPADDAAVADRRWVTVAVPATERPEGIARGDRVEVWIAPPSAGSGGTADGADRAAVRLAGDVAVEQVAGSSGGLGGTRESTVTLGLDASSAGGSAATVEELVGTLVAAAREGRVYLTVLPGDAAGAGGARSD
jgi:hypothetical protein